MNKQTKNLEAGFYGGQRGMHQAGDFKMMVLTTDNTIHPTGNRLQLQDWSLTTSDKKGKKELEQ